MGRNKTGRVTIPTDVDMVPQTLDVLKLWGADAIRDCDGTEFPAELADTGAKIYATYYTTRKDNAWAKAHPEEIQQCYVMTGFYTAEEGRTFHSHVKRDQSRTDARSMTGMTLKDGGKSWTAPPESRFRRMCGRTKMEP